MNEVLLKKSGVSMKKVIKSFTFWLLLIAVLEIIMHQIGQDSKSIVLIRFNPILNMIADSDGFLHNLIESGSHIPCNTISGQISIYWYLGSVLTLTIYGALFDCIKWLIHHLRSKRKA